MSRYETLISHLESTLPSVSPSELQVLMNSGSAPLVVDVREAADHQSGAVAKSISLPRAKLEANIERYMANPEQKVIVYCGSRGRSQLVCRLLIDMGIDAAFLRGGWASWAAHQEQMNDQSEQRGDAHNGTAEISHFLGGCMYTFQTLLPLPVEQAIPLVMEHLKQEGFGVLMDLDIQATMKQKIGADIPAYHILGACNPQLAHQALAAEPEVGALLPCNVVVRADGDQTVVSFMDPQAMTQLTTNPQVHAVANEAEARLRRVCLALEASLSAKK